LARTGPVTDALVEHGVDPARSSWSSSTRLLQLLRKRFPQARVVQGDAYRLRDTLSTIRATRPPVVSACRWMTKPRRARLRLLSDALALLNPTRHSCSYLCGVRRSTALRPAVEASERIWLNLPPARVWSIPPAGAERSFCA